MRILIFEAQTDLLPPYDPLAPSNRPSYRTDGSVLGVTRRRCLNLSHSPSAATSPQIVRPNDVYGLDHSASDAHALHEADNE